SRKTAETLQHALDVPVPRLLGLSPKRPVGPGPEQGFPEVLPFQGVRRLPVVAATAERPRVLRIPTRGLVAPAVDVGALEAFGRPTPDALPIPGPHEQEE